MSKFLRTKGFQHRLKGSVFLALITIPTYFLADGLPFRIVMTIGLALALVELYDVVLESFYIPFKNDLAVVTTIFFALTSSIIAIWSFPIKVIGGVVVVAVATDVFAYLGGKAIGGGIDKVKWLRKILGEEFTKSRPFPDVSPNKTWEGTLIGLVCGLLSAVLWTQYVLPSVNETLEMCFLWIPPFAMFGDLLESHFKRRAGVKDSNEFLDEKPVIGVIENMLGGKGGHGGYLDRLDSFSFVMFLLYIANLLGDFIR